MTPAFIWIQDFLHELEHRKIGIVYLRGHEDLPDCLGNDVDLLVEQDALQETAKLAIEFARRHGWMHVKSVEFGPLSMFFCCSDGEHFVHVDLFTSLEWHWLAFAVPEKIIARRQWNGIVFIPDPLDELFLNVMTRLFYHGCVRDKHREQAQRVLNAAEPDLLQRISAEHIGKLAASQVTHRIIHGHWLDLECHTGRWRMLLLIHALGHRPVQTLCAGLRYLRRGLRRLLIPPGPFLVFEGADGVGKSTVIEGILPMMKELTGRDDTLMFHWKPTLNSIRIAGEQAGGAQDPHGKTKRSQLLSLLFLCFHWLGFWKGYLRHVLPARAKNRAVLADRYAYEFFLDPARLRLQVPDCIARLAAATVPQPDLIICQIAPPEKIIERKTELSESKIKEYQNKLQLMALDNPRCVILDTVGSVDEVLVQARSLILHKLF
jgi:thymidylate kinase